MKGFVLRLLCMQSLFSWSHPVGAVSCGSSAEITSGCCQKGPELCDASSWLAMVLVVVSTRCELISWLVWKKLLCQVCHHVSKLNGLTLTAQSLAPVQETGWDYISGAREGRVFLLFHFTLQLLCTRSKLKFHKLLLSIYINSSP